MSTTTPALLSAPTLNTNADADAEPTIVETLEEAQFILEETPDAAILIQPKSVQL